MKCYVEHPSFCVELEIPGSVLRSRYAENFVKVFRESCGRVPEAVLEVDLVGVESEEILPLDTDGLSISSTGSGAFSYRGMNIEGEFQTSSDPGLPHRARFATASQLDHILAVLNIVISQIVTGKGQLLLHASAVDTPMGAIAFMGRQGAGKTTASRLLLTGLAGTKPISSDICIVYCHGDSCPTVVQGLVDLDFEGPEDWLPRPLTGLLEIRGWDDNAMEVLEPAHAIRSVCSNALLWVPSGSQYQGLLDAAARLVGALHVHSLRFRRDSDFARMMERFLASRHATGWSSAKGTEL
jgi:hypothetical protein